MKLSKGVTTGHGAQEPTIRVCPPYSETYGDDAADLAAYYGFSPDPWQRDVLRDWLAFDEETQRPIATTLGLSVPRQNGKTWLLEAVLLYSTAIRGLRCIFTAHEVKTARKAFQRLCAYFENERRYPELAALLKTIRRANGQESIELVNGGGVEFSARTRGAARGFADIALIVLDEAQELQAEQMEALLATMAASSSGVRQLVMCGTPTPPTSPGDVFERTRAAILNGDTPRACWHEWGVDSLEGLESWETVLPLVYATNPAMGLRLTPEFTLTEYKTLTPAGFARERLGWWQSHSAAQLISAEDWQACATKQAPPLAECKAAYGLKFTPDGSEVALAVALVHDERPAHVELINVLPNTAQTITALVSFIEQREDRAACFVIDGKGGSGLLTATLKAGGFPSRLLWEPRVKEVSTAAEMLEKGVSGRSVTWFDDGQGGQDVLTAAALEAVRRPINKDGLWAFGGENSAPLEAASLALYGARTSRRDPRRVQVVR